ncbi:MULTISPECIES: hypothetical protein [unclassified Microbacterium]|uniref:hypothetical protein n=1 Tax=unclassified Microbacterium TaxID=2609290 RepID=UPI001E3A3990|nr:hypothetical protein [Microbacterium sp. Au-Mic1]MCE4025755.1 hypothetical protein [Microbacterium sp. Au-Mic1]
MRTSRLTIAAAAVLALEAVALLVVTLMEVFGLSSGAATSLPSALGLIGLSAVGAVGLAALAFAVLRGRSFGRSGGMVVQILAIAVALSALTVRPFPVVFVLALTIPGAIGAVLLFLLTRRAGLDARRADAEQQDD